jgi:molybdate transport system substrate-binding protein
MRKLFIHHMSYPLAALVLLLLPAYNAVAGELTLAVANSTCNAIKKVGELYRQQHTDLALKYICKSSGRLAKGLNGESIEADIYISANKKWMDYMIAAELVLPGQVISAWGNELVVASPSHSNITNFSWEDLASKGIELILIGDPSTAPFGRYAKQSLTSSGLWKQVKLKIQTKKHITLLAEALSEASPNSVGILFLSNVSESLRVMHNIPSSMHDPIRYYLAPLKKVQLQPQVISFLNFIQSEPAQTVFLNEGFKIDTP